MQHAGWWDTAVHGNSALQAALRRCIQDEAYRALGIVTAGVYWDLEKLYDDVALLALISRAVKLGYHPMPLALALQLYLSHRVLTIDGAASTWVRPFSSVLAGDSQANCMAKIIIHSTIE